MAADCQPRGIMQGLLWHGFTSMTHSGGRDIHGDRLVSEEIIVLHPEWPGFLP